jgi:hypothetical protein
MPSLAQQVLAAVFTYWVEIMHAEDGRADWVHIHGLHWETTESFPDAWIYALRVRDDHPGAQVRVVESADDLPLTHIPVPRR